jgi:PTS system ascorbate-specific IIA component
MSDFAAAFGEGSIRLAAEVDDWREALLLAGELLAVSGKASARYGQAMVDTVNDLGPYIVIAPGIALGHARPVGADGANLVFETGMSLAVLKTPVEFGNQANDPVTLVFGLAALDHDSHLDVMAGFGEKLSDPSVVNSLLNAQSEAQIRQALS